MTSTIHYHSNSEAATDRFAAICAASVTDGITIALNGQLGSGKTRFVSSFCEALGVDRRQVTSPTFVLMQLYQGHQWSVSHFDTYRLADLEEFEALGVDEYLHDASRICLIEWADRVAEILPVDHVRLEIQPTGETERYFELSSSAEGSNQFLNRIQKRLLKKF